MDALVDEQFGEEPIETTSPTGRRQLVDWLPLVGLSIVFMLGNVLLPMFFWRMSNRFWLESIALFLNGVLASEAGILGVWMALGSERWPHRLLGTGLLLGLSATCLVIGLRLPPPHDLPVEIALLVYGVALGGWLGTWFVAGCLRAWFGWYIRSPRAQSHEPAKGQVSIGYLFAAITSVAFLIALVKAVMPTQSFDDNRLSSIAGAGVIYVLYSGLLLLPCCWIALQHRRPYWLVLILLLELYFLGGATMWYVARLLGTQPFDMRATAYFYEYSSGLIASALLVFALLRRCGFELRRTPPSRPLEPGASASGS